MTVASTDRRGGFVLLEVVLALTLFGMVGVALLVALEEVGDIARMVRSESQLTRLLDSELRKSMSLPTLEEGEESAEYEERDQLKITTVIRRLEDVIAEERMTNLEGNLLQDMFHIQVLASWYEDGEWQEMSAETWRYGRLYLPQR